MKKYIKTSLLIICIFTFSCKPFHNITYCTSSEVANKALEFAKKYKLANTKYVLGSQDDINRKEINIDCSGLIVKCYQYATLDSHEYELPFKDANVKDFYKYYSINTETPEPGDIIFMGKASNNGTPKHISIYVRTIENNIYFIDATKKNSENGQPYINGVTERCYAKNDKRFKGFAKIKLIKKK